MRKISIFTVCIFFYAGNISAQTEQEKLTVTILHLDSAFRNAYNNCDMAAFKNLLTDNVEFYHDKGGITTGAIALI